MSLPSSTLEEVLEFREFLAPLLVGLPNWSPWEFCQIGTHRLMAPPTPWNKESIRRLLEVCQEVRTAWNAPMWLSSFYRPVGGAPSSMHANDNILAADLNAMPGSNRDAFRQFAKDYYWMNNGISVGVYDDAPLRMHIDLRAQTTSWRHDESGKNVGRLR
jgi:hypothetical protein